MRNVMVLMAHADDETLGAGGYLPLLVARGHRVTVVYAADGVVTARGVHDDNRNDAERACEVLGVNDVRFLGFKDQRFDTYAIADIAGAAMDLGLEPDLIISHCDHDLNRDHRIVAEVARIVGRPKIKPVNILGCEIPNTSAWNSRPFPANYYVDITETIDTKIEAFCCYRNELQEFPHPWSKRGLRVLAEFRGMEAGFHCAEAFQVVRMFDARAFL